MKFLQNIHAIRDLVGLYGVTKIDKSEWKKAQSEQKLNRISGFSKHSKTQTVANAGGGGRI